MRYANSFVMNDYIHVDDRNDHHIWFEPFQPLCILNTIVGSLWAAGEPLFQFEVGRLLQGSHSLYRHDPSLENVGIIWQHDFRIVLFERSYGQADRYPQDIYVCASYQLDNGDDGEPEINWKKEGF